MSGHNDAITKCSHCGSENLKDGKIAEVDRFVPEGKLIGRPMFNIRAKVCLECGCLTNYITTVALQTLKD